MITADIVEVDVDAPGRGLGEALHQRTRLVVDHRIGPERTNKIALLRTTRGADHRHALGLGDLDYRRADRTSRGRDEHNVAGLCLRRIQQTPIGRAARQTEVAEERLLAHAGDGGQLVERRRRYDRLVAPACHVHDEVTRCEALRAALHDFADRTAFQWLPDLEWRDVAFHVVHPPAHVRVDAQPPVANAHAAFGELGQGHILELEVVMGRHAGRAALEVPGAGHRGSPSCGRSHKPKRKARPPRGSRAFRHLW